MRGFVLVAMSAILLFANNANAQGSVACPTDEAPLSAAEISDFRKSIAACWNVGNIDSDGKSATISFKLFTNGMLDGEPRIVKSSNSDNYDKAAVRAIERCAGSGYKLPVTKFCQWREIELRFDGSARFR